jgi:hypothetical protein
MTASGKTQITISAHYQDAHFLLQDRIFLAETVVHSLRTPMYSIVELRIVVPTAEAEALVRGMISGDAELLIQRMRPLIDADS